MNISSNIFVFLVALPIGFLGFNLSLCLNTVFEIVIGYFAWDTLFWFHKRNVSMTFHGLLCTLCYSWGRYFQIEYELLRRCLAFEISTPFYKLYKKHRSPFWGNIFIFVFTISRIWYGSFLWLRTMQNSTLSVQILHSLMHLLNICWFGFMIYKKFQLRHI